MCNCIIYDLKVAGGVAAGQSFLNCARKESQEEASVPEEYLDRLRPVGMLRYDCIALFCTLPI